MLLLSAFFWIIKATVRRFDRLIGLKILNSKDVVTNHHQQQNLALSIYAYIFPVITFR